MGVSSKKPDHVLGRRNVRVWISSSGGICESPTNSLTPLKWKMLCSRRSELWRSLKIGADRKYQCLWEIKCSWIPEIWAKSTSNGPKKNSMNVFVGHSGFRKKWAGTYTYRLDLPKTMSRLHPVFHVSLLHHAVENPQDFKHRLELPGGKDTRVLDNDLIVDEEGRPCYLIENILGTQNCWQSTRISYQMAGVWCTHVKIHIYRGKM